MNGDTFITRGGRDRNDPLVLRACARACAIRAGFPNLLPTSIDDTNELVHAAEQALDYADTLRRGLEGEPPKWAGARIAGYLTDDRLLHGLLARIITEYLAAGGLDGLDRTPRNARPDQRPGIITMITVLTGDAAEHAMFDVLRTKRDQAALIVTGGAA